MIWIICVIELLKGGKKVIGRIVPFFIKKDKDEGKNKMEKKK